MLPPSQQQESAHLTALKAAVTYLAIAVLWLIFTEQILNAIVDTAVKLSRAQLLKSISFMAMTSGLLYWLVRRSLLAARQNQRSLRDSRARTEALFNGSSDLMLVFPRSAGTPFSEVNDHACRQLGYSRAALCTHTIEQLGSPALSASLRALSPGDEIMVEGALSRNDEAPLPVEVHARCLQLADQQLIIATARDLRYRMEAERALQESERRYRLLAENATDIIWTLERDDSVGYVSPSAERILGVSRDVLQQDPVHFSTPPMRAAIRRLWTEESIHEQNQFSFEHPNGGERWLEVDLSPLRDSNGVLQGILGVSRDITARRAARNQLHQAQKMEAVGTLAGGVAHDLNNLLAVILGNTELAFLDASGPQPRLQQIQRAAERASALVRKLLLFSRQQPAALRPIDINTVVEGLLEMLGQLLGAQIQVQVSLTSTPSMVNADPNQMEQVLLNLAVNARDAMPTGGTLRFETDHMYLSGQKTLPDGDYVRIRVSDTGNGIPPETLARIFEPFFTTKEVGKGTGLGLSTAYGILQDHHGDIQVQSRLGRGTAFSLLLPASKEAPPHPPPAQQHPTQTRNLTGQKSVLIVEDESLVQTMISEVMSRQGYTVDVACSLTEARQKLATQHHYDLLISDVVLPDGIGYALIQEVRHIPMMMISGYAPEEIQERYSEFIPDVPLLRKPFTLQQLSQAVQDLDVKGAEQDQPG